MYFSEVLADKESANLSNEFEESMIGTSGKSYKLTFKLEGYILKGQIHDNNNVSFELLEESIKIQCA